MDETYSEEDTVVKLSENENYISHTNDKKASPADTGPKIGCRHVQMIILCLALVFGMGLRSNLSVAIVAMTDNTTSPNPDVPTYDWDNTSVILSSFFWSYISLQLVAAYLGKTYGPKYFLLVGFFVNCCACALIPLAAAKLGSTGVILCRVVQGFGQAFLYPSIHVLLGRWAPEEERNTLSNIVFAGASLASIFSSLLTGYVSASWWGWPVSFYILASLGVCWCVLLLSFGHNSPATHPTISKKERHYIELSLNQVEHVNLPVPWKRILTSVPFYAVLVGQLGNLCGWAIMMTETPTYLAKVMDFDVESNGLVSAILDLISLVVGLLMGRFSDWIVTKNYISVLNARKVFNLIGSYGQAVCLIWLSFLKPSQASWSVFVLGISNVLSCSSMVGSAINHVDLSPRFSGVLFGIINTVGQSFSLLGPLSANWIVTDLTSVSQWQMLFSLAAVYFIIGGTVFFFFASASMQPWDSPENSEQKGKRKKISVITIKST